VILKSENEVAHLIINSIKAIISRTCVGHAHDCIPGKEANIMVEEKIKTSPDICSYVNEDNNKLHLEIALPGVKKEDINLKLTDDSLYLNASREDVDYVATQAFCCPMNSKAAEAKYENGLLKLEVPFKDPLENAFEISIH
jgi:HSP20 family protein